MATEAPIAAQELPSGSFVSVKQDGFEISSNVGTAEDLKADLGIEQPTIEGQEPIEPKPSKARRPGDDPRNRRQSIQAQIDADVARRNTAKSEADAEEARLTKLRDDAKKVTQPAAFQPQQQPAHQQQPPPQPRQVKEYDGADPSDPEPTIEQFAQTADPYTARLEARQDWAARKEVRKFQATQQRQAQGQQDDTIYRHRVTSLTEKLKAHEAKDPEFKTKIDPQISAALTWTTPETAGTPLGDLVMDSPNPAELMIHFSQNKQEFVRIMNLHPVLQAVELGEIRGYLRAQAKALEAAPPKPRPISRASAPIKPLEGNPAIQRPDDKPEDEMSDDEHDAKYAKMRRQYR